MMPKVCFHSGYGVGAFRKVCGSAEARAPGRGPRELDAVAVLFAEVEDQDDDCAAAARTRPKRPR